jgi:hypothetical protein
MRIPNAILRVQKPTEEEWIEHAMSKKEWVGLTDEEFAEILCSEFQHRPELMLLQVQAKLKEKNT